jgi:hypothetical protein
VGWTGDLPSHRSYSQQTENENENENEHESERENENENENENEHDARVDNKKTRRLQVAIVASMIGDLPSHQSYSQQLEHENENENENI